MFFHQTQKFINRTDVTAFNAFFNTGPTGGVTGPTSYFVLSQITGPDSHFHQLPNHQDIFEYPNTLSITGGTQMPNNNENPLENALNIEPTEVRKTTPKWWMPTSFAVSLSRLTFPSFPTEKRWTSEKTTAKCVKI